MRRRARYLGPWPDTSLTSVLLEPAASTDWAAHPLAYRPARDQRGRSLEAAGAGVYAGVRLLVDLPAVGTTPARPLTRPTPHPPGFGAQAHAHSPVGFPVGCHAPPD